MGQCNKGQGWRFLYSTEQQQQAVPGEGGGGGQQSKALLEGIYQQHVQWGVQWGLRCCSETGCTTLPAAELPGAPGTSDGWLLTDATAVGTADWVV